MQPPRSLVLVTVDCLRADHVGFLGYERPTTPFLDCLSQEAVVFTNAIVAGAPTYYSVPAILASRYPLAMGRDLIGLALDEETLGSVLRDCGFATAAFSAGNPYIAEKFGFARGFDAFVDFMGPNEYIESAKPSAGAGLRTRANQALSKVCHAVPGAGSAYDELYFRYCQRKARTGSATSDDLRRYPSADIVVDRAITWLNENSGRPFFLWLHLMDPHAPYFPKPEALELMDDGALSRQAGYLNEYWNRGDLTPQRLSKRRADVVRLYDAGIRWADQQIRRFTEALVDLNLWDICAIAVSADHGEEFLEHGGRFHQPWKLTEELVHVPLLVRFPGQQAKRVDAPFGLIDLAPTLLDALGIPSPSDFRGRSCWTALQKQQPISGTTITECVHGCTNPFRRKGRIGPRILAVRKENFKLVIDFSSGSEQLFDLNSDPTENRPLPQGAASDVRKDLLDRARRHVVESRQSRDFDRRHAMLLRDFRLEWAQSTPRALEN